MATESRVTTEGSHPFSTGPRPLPRPQRLALEPQPAPREPQARGHRVPDRERHRGRRRLPRVAAARGRLARAGARGLPRRPRRLLHVRGRDGGRVRGAARSDRVQAGRARRDRRLGGDVVRVAVDRGAPRRGGRGGVGAGARRRLRLGEGARSDDGRRARARRGRGRRPRDDVAPRAQPAPPRPRGGAPGRGTSASSTRAVRTRSRAGSTPRSRSRSTGTWATTAPA